MPRVGELIMEDCEPTMQDGEATMPENVRYNIDTGGVRGEVVRKSTGACADIDRRSVAAGEVGNDLHPVRSEMVRSMLTDGII